MENALHMSPPGVQGTKCEGDGPMKFSVSIIASHRTLRSVLQTWKDQQKCASVPHFRPKDFSLQASAEANFIGRNEIPLAEKARKDAHKFG
jgi:hypothetical protein